MNAIINLTITVIVFGASYLVMGQAGVDHDTALSTAALVAATGALPLLKGTDVVGVARERRRREFERRLEVSQDRVKMIARETIEETRQG